MGTQSALMRARAPDAKDISRTLRAAARPSASATTATLAPRSFAAIPVFAPGERAPVSTALPRSALQRKLAIGAVDDPLEHEADRVADRVMRMPEPAVAPRSGDAGVLRRKCSCEASGEKCAACSAGHKEDALQRKAASAVAPAEAPPIVHQVLASPGQPLDASTRAFFEPRLQRNLGDVRVHADASAADSAKAVNALAYTVGRNVVFGQGQYSAGTDTGKRLLAHELTHVIQQSDQGAARRVQRTITVANPTGTTPPHTQDNGAVVVSLFNQLCPDTQWKLVSGEISPVTPNFCATAAAGSATPVSCQCACSFTSPTGPHVSIAIDPTFDDTQFASVGSANSFSMRLRGFASTNIHGVSGARVAPGASSVTTIADPPWVILGHELCGHALTTLPNIATAGRPSSIEHESTAAGNQSAVDIENQIRREHSTAGSDLGTRAGDFQDVEGNIHFGAIVRLPSAMTVATLLSTLGVPSGAHMPRCPVPGWYRLCGATTPIQSTPMLNAVAYRTGGNFNVAASCLNQSFASGDFFAVEGVFWHVADGAQTKTTIAARWGVTIAALDRANAVFAPTVAGLAPTAAVPTNTSVIIPYRLAPAATRFFFTPATGPC